MGQRLIPRLLAEGNRVVALARPGSEAKVPRGAEVVLGDALDPSTYTVQNEANFVHLVGTPHPSPSKAKEFRAVDLPALKASVAAALAAKASHFVFVSVAHPAPVMAAYIEVRVECEALIQASGIPATILRPWYVLGPGHWWPLALKPFYWIAEAIPSTRERATRLGLVTLEQMVEALAWAVHSPPSGTRILDVPAIRSAGSRSRTGSVRPSSSDSTSRAPATGKY